MSFWKGRAMELYIVRHGIAETRTEEGFRSDAERALTPKGRTRTREVARALRELGCGPARIGTSPLRRALETAQIMAEVLSPEVPPEVCEFLSPGAEAGDLIGWLKGLGEGPVMIVGHMPDVAEIASGLLTRKGCVGMVFRKAAACCISFQGLPAEGEGVLEWLAQPRHLCRLSGRGKK